MCVPVCLNVCDLETSTMGWPRPELDFYATEKMEKERIVHVWAESPRLVLDMRNTRLGIRLYNLLHESQYGASVSRNCDFPQV
jgi:hypothetical protein